MSKKYIIVGALVVLVIASWLILGSDSSDGAIIYASPKVGSFKVDVTTTGELRAKNSTSIRGPEEMRDLRLFNVKIQKIIPEGTVVKKGDFVAELDKSEVLSKLQDAQLEMQKVQSQFEQAQLDSALTLSQARDNLVNQQYTLEERKIAVEQSKYESPAVQRQAQIDLEKAQRQLKQEKKNYTTKVKQAEAKLREIEADLEKEKKDLAKIRRVMSQFRIVAPENGMVIYKRNRDGTKVGEGGSISGWNPEVAELPDFSVMESVTYVNEVDIQEVKTGQFVDVGLDADPEKKLTGRVTSVANIGEQRPNSNSKVFEVIVRINESDSTLRPAMTTKNVIHVESLDSALYVPLETIHTVDSLNFVYARDGLGTVMKQIVMGITNDNDAVIRAGIDPGDRLYLSTPADTAGIRKEFLPEEIVEKYSDKEKKPERQINQERPPQIPDEVKDMIRRRRKAADGRKPASGNQ